MQTSRSASQQNEPLAIDLLIEARWIIPVEPAGISLENHAVAIDSGKILDLLPSSEAHQRYAPRQTTRLGEHVLIPGLVNLHCHAAMSLLRGYADDLTLHQWLNERIWPAEKKHLSPSFVHDGTLLAAYEMLRGGITCCNDMYYFPAAAAAAFSEAGMRATLGITVIEFPTPYAHDADDYLNKGLAVRDFLRDDPYIRFTLAPHAPYTISDRTFERIATLADQLDLAVHMHVHESRKEIEESLQQYGKRPLARLDQLGLVGPNLIAVHAVHLEPSEIALLAERGCSVVHCPTSNMKLASGIAPVSALFGRGIKLGLGSDGAASNNRLDLLQEMRHATLLSTVASEGKNSLNAQQSLRMATLNGAAALGLEHQIGSIEIGKQADLCAIRLDDWTTLPYFDPASHIVYVAGREHVNYVWIAGKIRVEAGKLKEVELSSLIDSVKLWQNKLDS